MRVLSSSQRSTLEKAVSQARKSAEKGAKNALISLAVDQAEPFSHMSPDQRNLRNRLRQKGRLLGDILEQNGEQSIQKLSYELAYETWHKMLFAKFLEVNHLLMHPDGVAVTLMDCEELAAEEGHANKWETAMHYASLMLPAIFRPSDPVMQVQFASNDRIELEEIISALEDPVFQAGDALGWVYQYWQSEEKDRINKSGDKIDGEKLPAVTQLFTEQYMVDFLIDNTLGAWWVSRNPEVEPPVKFEYLRYLEDGTPAAGKFEGWPDQTAEVTSLDPCMGSGHFVVSLFPVFAKLRMLEEGLSKEEATDKVIQENLHGLEIDPRCTQIAAFNLALTAWKFCGHYKELPEMNLACSGIAPKGKEEDWVKLVGKVERFEDKSRMENGMRQLFRHFQLAPELGSLIDPLTIKPDAFTASFNQLKPVLDLALKSESIGEQLERGVMAAGIVKVSEILSQKYSLILTNVPFLGRGKFSDFLMNYSEINFPNSKSELGTIFIERTLDLLIIDGVFSFVSPQNWLFPKDYKNFRKKIFQKFKLNFLIRLGTRAFETISGEVVNVGLFSLSKEKKEFFYIDASSFKKAAEKNLNIKTEKISILLNQTDKDNYRLNLEGSILKSKLGDFCKGFEGSSTGDKDRFLLFFWELDKIKKEYEFFQNSPSINDEYSGNQSLIFWEEGDGELAKSTAARIQGISAFKNSGFIIGRVGDIKIGHYSKSFFDKSCVVLIPKEQKYLLPIYAFLKSDSFSKLVKSYDPRLGIATSVFENLPFDINQWEFEIDNSIVSNKIYFSSSFINQWWFHGNPLASENPLQVALGRLLGYQWPAESDPEMELDPKARDLIQEIQAFDHLSDEDGIFCIPSVNGEAAGADRLREYLQTVWGEEYDITTLTKLLEKEGAKSSNMEAYLRDEFFEQHCKVFNNRPFIWHIWDGRKDGFSALVNYHKLTKNNLSKLIYTYLGDWIRMCESKKKTGESGADGMLSAALKLKESLELILEGEKPYDIFVRWKPLSEQSIGWEPDLNDGVRLNIRPFMEAGILRKKPNIKWGKDRGKNPPGAPWGEERNNDLHLSLEEKRRARGI